MQCKLLYDIWQSEAEVHIVEKELDSYLR